ncbi:MAG: hypothetical protein QOJ90_1853 [Actinomycetota bacterium]|jgi:hypothetical protein|nr:hypothetical protein [Actinomycetota bacterium]MDQ1642502.1 hypothetical protein [Actinomycetota bacterium]
MGKTGPGSSTTFPLGRAGSGVGPLSGYLEPAMSKRISKTEYLCVAEVRSNGDHPARQVEIRITYAVESEGVTTSQLRRS